MKCANCGSEHAVHETRDVERDYRGATILIKGVTATFCPDCAEATMTAAEADVYMTKLKEARMAIAAGAHDAVLLESVRKKLGLTRKAAGEVFGGGVNAFSRYESGKAAPPKPLIQLFTILNNHPELARELEVPDESLPIAAQEEAAKAARRAGPVQAISPSSFAGGTPAPPMPDSMKYIFVSTDTSKLTLKHGGPEAAIHRCLS